MNTAGFVIVVFLAAIVHHTGKCSNPSEIYEISVLKNSALYGRCRHDAMQVAKSNCSDLMLNCMLEGSENRRSDCSLNVDVSNCEALKKELRDGAHRRLYIESRNTFTIFCEQWKSKRRPKIFEEFTNESKPPERTLGIETLYTLVRCSMESFLGFSSKLWRWSQSGLEMTRSSKYQLQVRLNHICNHCKSTVSQLSAQMVAFIRDTRRMWQLFSKIVATNVRRCERVQDDTPANLVAFLTSLESFLLMIGCLIFSRSCYSAGRPLVAAIVNATSILRYILEAQLIAYALNDCHDSEEAKFTFLFREQNALRLLSFKISVGYLLLGSLMNILGSLVNTRSSSSSQSASAVETRANTGVI